MPRHRESELTITKLGESTTQWSGAGMMRVGSLIKAGMRVNTRIYVIGAAGPGSDVWNQLNIISSDDYERRQRELASDELATLFNQVTVSAGLGLDYSKLQNTLSEFANPPAGADSMEARTFGNVLYAQMLAEYSGGRILYPTELVTVGKGGAIEGLVSGALEKLFCDKDRPVIIPGIFGLGKDGNRTIINGEADALAVKMAIEGGIKTVHIWSTLSGILSADPSIVHDPIPINELSRDEAFEIGAERTGVIAPEALAMMRDYGRPESIWIRDLLHRRRIGSLIRNKKGPLRETGEEVIAITRQGPIVSIDVEMEGRNEAPGIMGPVYQTLRDHDIPWVETFTSGNRGRVFINRHKLPPTGEEIDVLLGYIKSDLSRGVRLSFDEREMGFVSVIGPGAIDDGAHLLSQLEPRLRERGIRPRTFGSPGGGLSFTFAVDNPHTEETVRIAYETFFGGRKVIRQLSRS